jgi:hypothetical protein
VTAAEDPGFNAPENPEEGPDGSFFRVSPSIRFAFAE